MADKRITDLPLLTTADAADQFAIVDDSANITKRVRADGMIPPATVTATKIDFSTFPVPFKVGTTSLTSTGTKVITGLGFRPKALRFYLLSGAGSAVAYNAQGSYDGTNTISSSNAVAASSRYQFSSTSAIRFISEAGSGISSFNVTSLDADGFTLNVTEANSGGAGWVYEAYR